MAGGREESFREHYVRGLGMSARNNSLAYGYSVVVTASFAALVSLRGAPTIGDIFLFIAGASLPFAAVNVVVTRGFRQRVDQEPPVVVAPATSLAGLSISGAVGAAALIGWRLGGWPAWLVGSLLSTVVYLLATALEVALARRAHLVAGTDNLEER